MKGLIEFLRARLDQDEQIARAAARTHDTDTGRAEWTADGLAVIASDGSCVAVTELESDADDRAHIARHDPARVLREVEAQRRMIAAYEANSEDLRYPTHEAGMVDGLDWAMQFAALAYADHADYRQEWAP